MTDSRGKLVILSGPSGSGKSTLIDRLLADAEMEIEVCPSATTRPPRPDDQHIKRYVYLSHGEFEQARGRGDFLECAEVSGNWYGTLRQPVEQAIARGKRILLEIDVQGGLAVKRIYPESALIFLKTSSLDEYENRLRRRGTNTEREIQDRVQTARRELDQAASYDHLLVNDDLDRAVAEMRRILSE